jgi:hypothetical protein
MAKQKTVPLQVQIDGIRRYIDVPVGRAEDLHTYLRLAGVRAAPPQPGWTGFDSIELEKSTDVAKVQKLLNTF